MISVMRLKLCLYTWSRQNVIFIFSKKKYKKSVVVSRSEQTLCGRSLQTTGRSVKAVEGPQKTFVHV